LEACACAPSHRRDAITSPTTSTTDQGNDTASTHPPRYIIDINQRCTCSLNLRLIPCDEATAKCECRDRALGTKVSQPTSRRCQPTRDHQSRCARNNSVARTTQPQSKPPLGQQMLAPSEA